ncbi:hypothetical protein DFH09DRAFT_582253 [Mycena vulgaris]|nr:hypothetical protein DFH09DRAFT_582253 [Mycena vulgaris]
MSETEGEARFFDEFEEEDINPPRKGKGKGKTRALTIMSSESEDETWIQDEIERPRKGKGKGKGKARALSIRTLESKDEETVPSAKTLLRRAAGLTDDQLRAHREIKNSERCAARRQAAVDDPEIAIEQRKECGRGRSPMVVKVWTAIYRHEAARELAVQTALSGHASDLELVQAAVAAYTAAENQSPIPMDAPVWREFPPSTLALLAAAAANPTTWDIEPFLANGTVVVSDPSDPPPISALAVYLRRIAVKKKAIASLLVYLNSHPADASNTVLKLVLQGHPPESIQSAFRAEMVEYGLEGAVDEFIAAVQLDPATNILLGTRKAARTTSFAYAGITYAVACGRRGWDDLEGNADVRIVNFLQANDEKLEFVTYHLREIDTPITSALDVRTNGSISHKERIVRAVLGATAMNSAHGGVQPFLLPSQHFVQLRHQLLALHHTIDPFPLGQERDLPLEARIRMLLDDEAQVFRRLHNVNIPAPVLETTKHYAADVIRLKHGKRVKVEITKDIPTEAFHGKCGAYWQGTVGQGPREHRYLRHLLEPQIPLDDDLDVDTLAQHMGPTFNFWRLILLHWWYLLHILFTSRICHFLRPLLIVTQSNPVAAMMRSGDLVSVWASLSDEDKQLIMAGTTPIGIENRFPETRYREFRKGEFTAAIGTITIINTSPDPASLSFQIAHGHYGRFKYVEVFKRLRWDVDFLVELKAETVVQCIAARLNSGALVDWDEAGEVRRWLEAVKADAEAKLVESGVSQALEVAKNAARRTELAISFLRAAAPAKRAHERWMAGDSGGGAQSRREGLRTAASGVARQEQLDSILRQARELDSFDLPPDPNHLGSWDHPILSESFSARFLKLPDNRDVVYASNALGRSAASAAAVKANQQAIGEWRRQNTVVVYVDTVSIARKNMLDAAKDTAQLGSYLVADLLRSWRAAACQLCGSFAIGRHNNAYHQCDVNSTPRPLTAKNFPDVERVLYAHDIFNNPRMVVSLGDIEDVLAELNLVAVSVRDILESTSHLAALRQIMRPEDVAAISAVPSSDANVYVPEERLHDADLLITLAVDTVLATQSTCPVNFLHTDPACRMAWTQKELPILQKWFANRDSQLYMVACDGPTGSTGDRFSFVSTKVIPRMDGGLRIDNGRTCGRCKSKTCHYRRFHPVNTLLDLSPHHARAIWLSHRCTIQWPPKLASRANQKDRAGRKA